MALMFTEHLLCTRHCIRLLERGSLRKAESYAQGGFLRSGGGEEAGTPLSLLQVEMSEPLEDTQ